MTNDIDPRLVDHAKNILESADISRESKAGLWDHFHDATDSHDLARRIAQFGAPQDLKDALVHAKRISQTAPLAEPEATVVQTLTHMSQIDKTVLEVAEKHPRMASALIAAALREESQ